MSGGTPKAAILMATYNGELYLREQLDSILNQTLQDIRLIVRDDGSRDGTLAVLQEYAARDSRVTVHACANVGAIASFLDLLRLGRGAAPVFFFSDQDDIWKPEKLEVMTRRVESFDPARPGLYFTSVRLVDAAGIPLDRQLPFFPAPRFGQALVQGVAQGCVMAFNAALLDLLADRLPDPGKIVMHDMWTMIVAAAMGRVEGDPLPFVDYRQHGRNVFGGQTGWAHFRTRLTRVLKGTFAGRLADQAGEFERLFGDGLSPADAATLRSFLAAAGAPLPRRAAAVLSPSFGRFSRTDDLLMRLLLLWGFHRRSAAH